MQFIDFYKKVKDNRQEFIDYYVKQFGEDTRQMFEDRFDKIKFVFFVTPDSIANYVSDVLEFHEGIGLPMESGEQQELFELQQYGEQIREKEESLGDDLVSIANGRIISSNLEDSDVIDINYILGFDETFEQITDMTSSGDTTIYFCPFSTYFRDVDFRHELRHAMTSSYRELEDGTRELKCGNSITIFRGNDKYIDVLDDFNELVTQYEARKETNDAFSRRMYIFDKEGTSLGDLYSGSVYDYYLKAFGYVYESLPKSAKRSQIEENNDSLYTVIPQKYLQAMEEIIRNHGKDDDKSRKKLKTLAEIIKEENGVNETPLKKSKRRRERQRNLNTATKDFLELFEEKLKGE